MQKLSIHIDKLHYYGIMLQKEIHMLYKASFSFNGTVYEYYSDSPSISLKDCADDAVRFHKIVLPYNQRKDKIRVYVFSLSATNGCLKHSYKETFDVNCCHSEPDQLEFTDEFNSITKGLNEKQKKFVSKQAWEGNSNYSEVISKAKEIISNMEEVGLIP